MTNRTTLAQLREMDIAQAARLPVGHLAMLLDEVATLKVDAKHLTELLHDALDQAGSSNHQGDDISAEAIAKSNPDWLIVMDRDAAIGEENATAAELIERSEALQDVTAVKEGNIVYLPADFYVAEDIQNHTTVMEDLAKAFEGAQ